MIAPEPSKKEKTPLPLIWKLVILSVLLHLLFFLITGFLISRNPPEPIKPPPVWVKLNKPAPKQIADIAKPKKEEKPDKASAEALYNQKVAEETVQERTPAEPAKPTTPGKPAPPPEPVEKKPETKKEVPNPEAPKKPEAPTPTQKPVPEHIPGMPDQVAMPRDDILPGYKVGNRTYINTEANQSVQYFVELKRKFRLTFSPQNILRAHASEIHGSRVAVVLGVSVTASGNLAGIIVIKSSGIPDYDAEARRTVQSSAPFSPPPSDRLTPEGLLDMAWTFIVSIY